MFYELNHLGFIKMLLNFSEATRVSTNHDLVPGRECDMSILVRDTHCLFFVKVLVGTYSYWYQVINYFIPKPERNSVLPAMPHRADTEIRFLDLIRTAQT